MNTRGKPPNSPRGRPTVRSTITGDLGYCCEWFFFQHFKQVSVVAARLGFEKWAIQEARRRCKRGVSKCEGHEHCMHKLVTLEGSPRKKRMP